MASKSRGKENSWGVLTPCPLPFLTAPLPTRQTSILRPDAHPTWSMVRPLATNSLRLGMSTPYTLGYTTGGEAEARYTLRAPARRTMSTICGGVGKGKGRGKVGGGLQLSASAWVAVENGTVRIDCFAHLNSTEGGGAARGL